MANAKPAAKVEAGEFPLETMRHSCSHVMAAAILQIYPEARFGVGPAIDNGFYYDILTDEPVREEDLARIESAMRKLRKGKKRFSRQDIAMDEAISQMDKMGQNFKVELMQLLKERGSTAVAKETGDAAIADDDSGLDTVSFYKTDNFIDLCKGPHVDHSGQIGVFKLTTIAGAYWRGDENNQQLQRIYGLCFNTQEELDAEIWRLEELKKRDHRRVGRDLELFMFSPEVGSGLPLWLPKGMVIRQELELLAQQEERKDGYMPVATPHITKEDLYIKSGHLEHYAEDMYSPMDIDGEKFYLKPMNCPHHHQLYDNRPHSYRELPIRFSEYGQVYRYEASGGLSGLMRVRAFAQNDAHIYCRPDQAKDEFLRVMQLHARYYEMFDIKEYYMLLALPDLGKKHNFLESPQAWEKAITVIREAMDESGYPYEEEEGEAAFYGPKVDFMIKSVLGTEYAISTNQLDFMATDRFDLGYIAEDGEKHPLYVIHRAPLGSHERFTAFLIEHYAGAFPTWLSPVQAMVVPIADRHAEYAYKVRDTLMAAEVHTGTGGLRVEVDDSSERMQKKIRNAQLQKIPYMLVVGDAESDAGGAAVRLRSGKDLGAMPINKILDRIKTEIAARKDLPEE